MRAARRRCCAGRVYIIFAVAGEIALFAGLALGAFATGDARLAAMASPEVPALATALMAAGLLVKLGAVPLHLWLPLAHAAAPAPASAVLSGAMLKAGLFGLMTVLPLGGIAAPEAAAALAAMALAGLILAPALGLVQGDAKAVLAYSSIGQMSLMALGLAAALAAPGAWPVIAPALVLLAAHHAFAKAALFLGVPAVWASSGRPAAGRGDRGAGSARPRPCGPAGDKRMDRQGRPQGRARRGTRGLAGLARRGAVRVEPRDGAADAAGGRASGAGRGQIGTCQRTPFCLGSE